MNTEKRKRLRELAEKATPGPWELEERGYSVCPFNHEDKMPAVAVLPGYVKCGGQEDFWNQWIADADFIAASRAAVPDLLDALDEADAENAALRARVEKLEEVRKAAGAIWESSEGMAIPPLTDTVDALRAALDRAGEP